MYFLVTTRTFLGLPVEQISSFQERCFTLWQVKRLPRIWPVYTKWNLPSRSFIKFSAGGKLLLTLKCNLSLYSLRLRAVFPKLANKDTLPVYNIPFESHWAAYLRTDISSYEGGRHFERNCFKMQKWTTWKMYHSSTIMVGELPLNYSLLIAALSAMWNKSCIPFAWFPKRKIKTCGGGQSCLR